MPTVLFENLMNSITATVIKGDTDFSLFLEKKNIFQS